jgi:amidase
MTVTTAARERSILTFCLVQNPGGLVETKISEKELQNALSQLGMSTKTPEIYSAMVEANLEVTALVDTIELPPIKVGPRPWERPAAAENPLGAWYVKTNIAPTGQGKLSGRSVAIKDTVLLAGVPLMGGSNILDGYVPDQDAEIVTRMLDAGATITGKSVCEAYCFSGGSHTSDTGPVRNPRNPNHTSGGSSSGSGALVASGQVDMAIGCDQGGSIRIPSSYCGLVGMKPTYGLVPYTGILGMNPNVDHTGPITRTVEDNALLLEVLAGPDGIDSRQSGVSPQNYTSGLAQEVSGLRIGLVAEGFGREGGDPRVDEKVRAACGILAGMGVIVSDVSIPMHLLGAGITFAGIQSMMISMFHLDGCPLERPDVTPEGYLQVQSGWRERADELPHNVKVSLLTTQILQNRFGFTYISRAMQRLPLVRAAYDIALNEVDILVMPTTITTAPPLPPKGADAEIVIGAAFGPLLNTAPFNSTHHPAISIPCGVLDGLPVGMMLVGRHWEEATLYRVAHALEQRSS